MHTVFRFAEGRNKPSTHLNIVRLHEGLRIPYESLLSVA